MFRDFARRRVRRAAALAVASGVLAVTSAAASSAPTAAAPRRGVLPAKLQDLLYPTSAATFRSDLVTRWGFPTWWPVPDEISTDRKRTPTILSISVEAEQVPTGTSSDRIDDYATDYYLPRPVDAVDRWLTGRIPIDVFELAGTTRRVTAVGGSEAVSLAFATKARPSSALTAEITETVASAQTRAGSTLRLRWSPTRADSSPPKSPALTALIEVPTPPGAVWRSFRAAGGVNPFATDTLLGEHSRAWLVPQAHLDSAKAFLSAPANYRGAVRVAGAPRKTERQWSQPLTFEGVLGDVAVLDPTEPQKPSFVRMSFRVSG